MKEKKILLWIILMAIMLWLLSAIVGSAFNSEKSFFDLMFFSIPIGDFVTRIVLIILFGILLIFLNREGSLGSGGIGNLEITIPDGIRKMAENDPELFQSFFHRIRTQLNNIFGFSDLLRDENLSNKESDRYFGYIESSKQSILAAVDEMIGALKMGKVKPLKKGDDYLDIIDWSGKKILIAEDVETNYIVLKAVLEKTGAEIIWAKNGMEAVKLFRRNHDISLILMDILMPEMDGFEATKSIRKFNKDVPIIAQTAYNFDWNSIQQEGLGFNDYLAKPIGHYDLILKAYRYIENQ